MPAKTKNQPVRFTWSDDPVERYQELTEALALLDELIGKAVTEMHAEMKPAEMARQLGLAGSSTRRLLARYGLVQLPPSASGSRKAEAEKPKRATKATAAKEAQKPAGRRKKTDAEKTADAKARGRVVTTKTHVANKEPNPSTRKGRKAIASKKPATVAAARRTTRNTIRGRA